MKKVFRIGLVFGILLMLMALIFASNVSACKRLPTDLVYGRKQEKVGDVLITHNWRELIITYDAADGWTITETHVAVGKTLNDIPTTKKGNPKIGHFPYSGKTGTHVEYRISFSELGVERGDTVIVAVHAVVKGPCGQEETAWADTEGEYFPGGSSTALWLSFTII